MNKSTVFANRLAAASTSLYAQDPYGIGAVLAGMQVAPSTLLNHSSTLGTVAIFLGHMPLATSSRPAPAANCRGHGICSWHFLVCFLLQQVPCLPDSCWDVAFKARVHIQIPDYEA